MSHQDTKTPRSHFQDRCDELATLAVDAAFKVHSALGPGLLETVYETCFCQELATRDLMFERQVAVPIRYKGTAIDSAFRADVIIEKTLLIELKATERHNPLYDAQVLTYLKLSGCRLGLLINFNSVLIKNGIKRMRL